MRAMSAVTTFLRSTATNAVRWTFTTGASISGFIAWIATFGITVTLKIFDHPAYEWVPVLSLFVIVGVLHGAYRAWLDVTKRNDSIATQLKATEEHSSSKGPSMTFSQNYFEGPSTFNNGLSQLGRERGSSADVGPHVRSYADREIFLVDLLDRGIDRTKHLWKLDGFNFTRCVIRGPVVLFPLPNTGLIMASNHFLASSVEDMWFDISSANVSGVVGLSSCIFTECRFLDVAFTGPPALKELLIRNSRAGTDGILGCRKDDEWRRRR